ncbi:MAG: hypothetical protein QOK28_3118 [Actinomycetota bacterium]|jgi:ABC-2 type transport system ATP-binding protein
MTTLEFDNVTKTYGENAAVDGLSLEVASGTWLVVVGPNGSGKTTMLRLASGLLSPSSGIVRVGDAVAGSRSARREVSYLSDSPAFYSDLSVAEHIDYLAGLFHDAAVAGRAHEIIGNFGLRHRVDDAPDTFSRGMKQKTAIALALARPFSILLLDEPTRGLDVEGTDTMVQLLSAIHAQGASVITVSHEPEKFVVDGALELRVHDAKFDRPQPLV